MGRIFMIVAIIVTIALIAIGTASAGKVAADESTPDGTVKALYAYVQAKDWKSAYELLSNKNNVDLGTFVRDVNGNNGDLRTFSTLSKATPKVLKENDNQALVRTDLQW